jgi:hypothetical protein
MPVAYRGVRGPASLDSLPKGRLNLGEDVSPISVHLIWRHRRSRRRSLFDLQVNTNRQAERSAPKRCGTRSICDALRSG